MKNKAYLKYCLILITTFFIATVVKAETNSVKPGTTATLINSSKYEWGSGVCKTSAGQMATTNGSSIRLKHGTLFYENGNIKFSSDSNVEMNETEDDITCNYDKNSQNPSAGAGQVTISIKYAKIEGDYVEDNFTLDQQKNVSYDYGTRLGVISKITEVKPDSNTQKYLDIFCNVNGTTCSVRVKENVTIPETGAVADFNFTYVDSDGATHHVHSSINISSTIVVFAYGGAYGTCKWNSNWEKLPKEQLNQSNDSENTRKRKFSSIGESIDFPTCTPDKSAYPFLKFKGFSTNSSGLQAGGSSVQASGLCEQFLATGAKSGDNLKYFACYTNSGGVVLSIDGTINDKNFKYDSALGYYYRTMAENDTVALPTDVKLRVSEINPDAKFIGWVKQGGSCETDLITGSVGPGTYTACTEMKTNAAEDYNKEMNEGTQEVVSKVPGYNTDMIGCSSESTNFIETSYDGNTKACTVKAKKDTAGAYITVSFQDNQGHLQNYKIKVIGKKSGDSIILDSTNGTTVDDSVYGNASDSQATTCDEFNISVNESTKKESGYQVAKLGSRVLRVHLYNGSSGSSCGTKTDYVGVCMDPGRQEPENSDKYYKERNLNPQGNEFDKVVATIYSDSDFLSEMNKYVSNGKPSGINHIVSATVAIRLAAIRYGEDANNSGLGLDEYYAAYKEIVNNINKDTGGKKKSGSSEYTSGDWKNIKSSSFCYKMSSCEFNSTYANIVAGYLKDAATSNGKRWDMSEVTSSVTDTKTEWNNANQYTKTITGVISGLKGYSNGDLRMTASCDAGLKGGNKSYKARCVMEVKNTTGKNQGSCANGEWCKVSSKTNYWKWANANSAGGKLYYRLTITQTADKLSRIAQINAANDGTTTDYNASVKMKYTSQDIVDNVAVTAPSKSNSKQRMILFPIDSKTAICDDDDICTGPDNGSGNDDGSNWGDKTGLDNSIKGNVSLDVPNDNGEPLPLVFITKKNVIGTTLPSCDTTKDMFNYNQYCTSADNCKEPFNKEAFRIAGCCSFVLDSSKYVYQSVCTDRCTMSSLNPVCNASSTSDSDVLELKEAYNKADGENYTCVVDVGSTSTTDKKKDMAGNYYSLEQFKSNPYCRVSCKEDWEFKFPSYKNFTGKNAVLAGSYFIVKDASIFASGSRTCVTTQIKHDQFKNEFLGYAVQSYKNFDTWQEKKAEYEAYQNGKVNKIDGATYCASTPEYHHDCASTDDQGNCNSWSSYYTCSDEKVCQDYELVPKTGVKYKKHASDDAGGVEELTYSGDTQKTTNGTSWSSSTGSAGSCDGGETGADLKAKHSDDGSGNESAMNTANANMSQAIKNINACDDFELVSKNTKDSKTDTKIMTVFDPAISFDYDEEEFMKEVLSSGSNKLVKKDEGKETRSAYAYATLDDRKKYTGSDAKVNNDGNSLESHKSPVYKTVCTSGGSGTAVVGSNKESSGHLVSWSSGPSCYQVTAEALFGHDYIKRTISNSSTFASEYKWYVNKTNDTKIYTKKLSTYPKSGITSNPSHWSLLGSSNQGTGQKDSDGKYVVNGGDMVFPVKVTTPRNMYKYTYLLTNIGMYNNSLTKVGRLMGGTNPVAGNNTRTCFYEVLENICLCCADVIDTEVVSNVSKLSTSKALSAAGSSYKVSSYKGVSEDDKKNVVGQLGFYNNTVSLADFTGGSNRDVGSNWRGKTKYLVEGNVEVTNKGAVLKNYIESKGENVYNDDPEYSYTLNPAAMSAIRTYNETNGYQVRATTLTTYGPLLITSNNIKNWKVTNDNIENKVSFNHYGSRFLEVNLKNYKNGTVLSDKTGLCYVYVPNINEATVKQTENKLKSQVNIDIKSLKGAQYYNSNGNKISNLSSCRWIDYVSETSKAGYYSRLAFK